MKAYLGFAAGVVVGIAAAMAMMRDSGDDRARLEHWRERTGDTEKELTATRRQLASSVAQLEDLTRRFQALSDRFDALSATASKVSAEPAAVPTQVTLPLPSPLPEATAALPIAAAGAAAAAAATPEFQPVAPEQWEALVRGTLQSEIERRLGSALPPEREQRLMDELGRLRDASRSLVMENLDPGDSERARMDLMRSVVLLQVDRAFREELGVGVAEFLRDLEPEQLEEIPPALP